MQQHLFVWWNIRVGKFLFKALFAVFRPLLFGDSTVKNYRLSQMFFSESLSPVLSAFWSSHLQMVLSWPILKLWKANGSIDADLAMQFHWANVQN